MGEAWPVKVRYTLRAFRQINAILDYIQARSPKGAENVKGRLYATIDRLAEHPHSGQVTNTTGLRRAIANPYPYVIFYEPIASAIIIHSVRHAARPGKTESAQPAPREAIHGQPTSADGSKRKRPPPSVSARRSPRGLLPDQ